MKFISFALLMTVVIAFTDSKGTNRKHTNGKFTDQIAEQTMLDNKFDNFVISPASLELALILVQMGARGNTYDQIANVSNIRDLQLLKSYTKSLMKQSKFDESISETLNIFIGGVLNTQHGIERSYLEQIEESFNRLRISEINSTTNVDELTVSLNELVKDETDDCIKEIVPRGSINSETSMALISTVYLKSFFSEKFESFHTSDFNTLSGVIEPVEMMQREKQYQSYYDNEEVQIVKLEFENTNLSLYVILPKYAENSTTDEKTDLLQGFLNKGIVEKILDNDYPMKAEHVQIYLPKFKSEYNGQKIIDYLKTMGVKDAFDTDNANFSDIFKNYDKQTISQINHKAFIEIQPDGVKGYGTTISRFEQYMFEEAIHFEANNPFLYFISLTHEDHENSYETVLFIGQFVKP